MSSAPRESVRQVFLRCLLPNCGAELVCPDGTDEWGWLKTEPVAQFRAEHMAHGSERTVGAEVRYIEKD